MAKAKKSLKGLGARYGIKLRKQYTKIHLDHLMITIPHLLLMMKSNT